MRLIKPKSLKQGDVIGIATPASSLNRYEALEKGIRYIESIGFRVELAPNVYKECGYLAGNDDERLKDIHLLFNKKSVKCIFAARGGYGSMRLINKLDYSLIKRNPKILVGYSDITALQLAILAKTGLISFSGPMVGVELADGLKPKQEEQFWQMLTSSSLPDSITIPKNKQRCYSKGFAKGCLLGGNLSIISALIGTSYFPNISNTILFLEEIDERPYRIDRMLMQLKLAGIFYRTNGILLGMFTNCIPEKRKPSLSLEQVLQDLFNGCSFPVIGHIPYGHRGGSLTFPIGIQVQFDTKSREIKFLESPTNG